VGKRAMRYPCWRLTSRRSRAAARRRGVTLRSESLLLPMIDADDALRRSATLHFASGVPLTNVFERRTFALHDQAP
jgi:hypothetical protein